MSAPANPEKVIDLDAIRDRVKAARRDGEYSYGEEAQEHVADLLVLLDEARSETAQLLTALDRVDHLFYGWSYDDVFGRVEQMRITVRETLARFSAPSPTDGGV